MANLCPICKSSLYHAAPARENHDVPLENVPEHLQDHQCCGTKCGHLIHKVCLCRELLGKSTPKCPVCSKELVIGEVNPLNLPPPPPKSTSRWVHYPKPTKDSPVPPIFLKRCSQTNKRPAFLLLNRAFSEPPSTDGNHPPAPQKEPRADEKLNFYLLNLEAEVIDHRLQSWIPRMLQDTISQTLRVAQKEDEPLETQMTAFVRKMEQLKFSKEFHSFKLLPGAVNWILGLDAEVAQNWIDTWNGHLQALYDYLISQKFFEGRLDDFRTYLLASLPELLAASQNIGAVDFFRLMLMYNELNRDGRLDTLKSRLEKVFFLFISQTNTPYSWSRDDVEVKQSVAYVVALMESTVDWMMEQGLLEPSVSSSASQTE